MKSHTLAYLSFFKWYKETYLVSLLRAAGDWEDVGLLPGVSLGEEVSVVDDRGRWAAAPVHDNIVP